MTQAIKNVLAAVSQNTLNKHKNLKETEGNKEINIPLVLLQGIFKKSDAHRKQPRSESVHDTV